MQQLTTLIQIGGTGKQSKVRDPEIEAKRNVQYWFDKVQEISYSVPMRLPLRRNHNFTGRDEELLRIHKVVHGTEADPSHQRIMALYGLGGVGKSQLATQYVYEEEDTYTSVRWVNANTTASLTRDILAIAHPGTGFASCPGASLNRPNTGSVITLY